MVNLSMIITMDMVGVNENALVVQEMEEGVKSSKSSAENTPNLGQPISRFRSPDVKRHQQRI
jgi:hypothetical protein